MSTFDDLKTAKFRNTSFLVPAESKQGGPKTVSHEYPGSSKRFTENLGKIPPIFTLDCIIHGSDSINKRLQFENALDQESIGTLVHPIYGTIDVKVAGGYTVSSNDANVGEHRFQVTFETTEPNITPAASSIDKGLISSNTSSVLTSLDNGLEEAYTNPTFSGSLNSASERITKISSSLSTSINKVIEPIQDKVSAFNRVVIATQNAAFTITQKGSTLKEAITDLYTTFIDIASTPQDMREAWEEILDFGAFGTDTYNSDSALPASTIRRSERVNNIKILDEHTQLTALANLFEVGSYINFKTVDDLQAFELFLNNSYQELLLESLTEDTGTTDTVSFFLGDPTINTQIKLAINPDIRTSFSILRNNVSEIFNQKEQNIWKTKTIDSVKSSMFLTAYRFYGNVDDLDLLTTLNPDKNISGFQNETTMLTK